MRRLFVPLGLGLALLAGCGRANDAADATAAVAPHELTPAQLSFLKFTRVAEVEASSVANLSGTIDFDEQRTARLNAPVAGRVVELLVQVGDHIDADQPLVALESPEVRSAEADYVHAEADLVVARKAAERAERLRAARAIAEKDYLQAQEDAQKAAADFERARAQLERLRVTPGARTSRYLVRAPFAGTVVARKASVGMSAGPDSPEPLAVVSDLSQVRVVVRVPERQLPLVRPHQTVTVHVEAYPDEFPGEVTVIGDVVDDATRHVRARDAEGAARPAHPGGPGEGAPLRRSAVPGDRAPAGRRSGAAGGGGRGRDRRARTGALGSHRRGRGRERGRPLRGAGAGELAGRRRHRRALGHAPAPGLSVRVSLW